MHKKRNDLEKGGVLARWISDFDCECQTDFWYCIKDSPFDINGIKSKKRYYIKKGMEHFDVREIKIVDYLDDLYIITDKALQTYNDYAGPEDKSTFVKELCSRDDLIYLGAFDKETKKLCGYIKIKEYESYVDFMSMKSDPESEKKQINAAMVMALCEKYAEKLNQGGFYICDGMRAINHETNFQNWLEKNFVFRKAYCRLHIAYPMGIGIIIKVLYPFRQAIKISRIPCIHKIAVILKYEEISRITKKQLKTSIK